MSNLVANVLDLGEVYTGVTLRGQLYNMGNTPVGSELTGAFYERAGNKGLFAYALTTPDNHQGWCDVYRDGDPGNVIATIPINPAEVENADMKISSLNNLSAYQTMLAVEDGLSDYGAPRTGDINDIIGTGGANLTSIGDSRLNNLDAAITSRLADGDYTAPPSAADVRTEIDTNSTTLSAIWTLENTIKTDIDDTRTQIGVNGVNLTALASQGSLDNLAATIGNPDGVSVSADIAQLTTILNDVANAITALHNLSTSDIDARLAAYDGVTQADLDTAKAVVLAAIAALNNLSQSQAQAAVAAALLAYSTATAGNVTSAQTAITAAIAALNNLSQAQAQTAATAALNAYAGPTKAELDAAQAVIQADIAGIESGGSGGSSAADIWTYPDRTLTRFGNMTGIEFTYTVTNSVNGLPISGVAVWFAVDGGGAQIVWSGHTDALGVARDAYGALPRLDPGTYYVFRMRPGYVFRNPDTEIINE